MSLFTAGVQVKLGFGAPSFTVSEIEPSPSSKQLTSVATPEAVNAPRGPTS